MANVAAYEGERFDAVISLFGSFSHVLEPQRAAASIAQVCRPGGRIFVMVYSRHSLRNLARCIGERSLAPVARLQHYRVRNQTSGGDSAPALAYTKRELKALFRGFDDIEIVGLNAVFELGPAKALVRAKIRGAGAAAKALGAESRLLRPFPDLCHMLVLTAVKPA